MFRWFLIFAAAVWVGKRIREENRGPFVPAGLLTTAPQARRAQPAAAARKRASPRKRSS